MNYFIIELSAAGPEDAGEDAAMKNLEQEYLEYLEFLEYLERNEELKNNLKEQEETEQVGGKNSKRKQISFQDKWRAKNIKSSGGNSNFYGLLQQYIVIVLRQAEPSFS